MRAQINWIGLLACSLVVGCVDKIDDQDPCAPNPWSIITGTLKSYRN